MGSIKGITRAGTPFSKRVSARTRRIQLTSADLASVNLEGIEDAPALEYFDMGIHALRDLDLGPLARAKVAYLVCRAQDRLDLAPLQTCEGLTKLSIDVTGSGPLDLGPLATIKGLTSLSLGVGQRSTIDLAPLSNLPLTHLSVNGDFQTLDVEQLRGKPLVSVTLNSKHMSTLDLSALATPALESLNLQGLPLGDPPSVHTATLLLPLAVCTRLWHLHLGEIEFDSLDVTPVVGHAGLVHGVLPNVKSMYCAGTPDDVLSPLFRRALHSIGFSD